MSLESGSTRNTLGSQLSTASSSTSSGSSKGTSNGKRKQYWQKDKKMFRILTVIAYIASVSMAAVLLSAYYVFLWTPEARPEPPRIRSSLKVRTERPNFQAEAHTSSDKELLAVLETLQSQIQPTPPITTKSVAYYRPPVIEDTGEDDDEYQYQPRIREKAIVNTGQQQQQQIPVPYDYYSRSSSSHSSNSNKLKDPSETLSSSFSGSNYYSRNSLKASEESTASSVPIALPLIQNPLASSVTQLLSLTASSSSTNTNSNPRSTSSIDQKEQIKQQRNETNNITSPNTSTNSPSNKSSSSRSPSSPSTTVEISSTDDYELSPTSINKANTLPYRRRQIPTPSSPLTITKMISSVLIPPTTTVPISVSSSSLSSTISSSSSSLENLDSVAPTAGLFKTTQPMLSLLQSAAAASTTQTSSST